MRSLCILAATFLTAILGGCGAYFVSTDPIDQYLEDGAITYGTYEGDGLIVVLTDGENDNDLFCAVENNQVFRGTVDFVTLDAGTVAVLSELVYSEGDLGQEIDGILTYFLIVTSDQVIEIHDPIREELNAGMLPPFAKVCSETFDVQGVTLSDSNFEPICLNEIVAMSEINDWFSSLEVREPIARLQISDPSSGIPYDCIDQSSGNVEG